MSNATRIIARLDVKTENVIKGVHLEGLRIVGKPDDLAQKYTAAGADEIYYIDSVASLYGRNNILEVVKEAAKCCRIPMTVEGGLRAIADIEAMLHSGADKIGINTAAIKNPSFLREAARIFGSQCIVLSITAKRVGPGKWLAYTDNGRENSGVDVLDWVARAGELDIGEILLTSIDREGTQSGFDLDLCREVRRRTAVPVVASGGAGSGAHILDCLRETGVDAVALASVLHYDLAPLPAIKETLAQAGVTVRPSRTPGLAAQTAARRRTASIVDLQLGNLYSLQSSFKAIGAASRLVSTPEALAEADCLVLPGVGAFGHGMENMRALGLIEAIREYARSGRPLLGICLGAQFLLDSSEEFGQSQGLGLVPGAVRRIDLPEGGGLRIPFMGWSRIRPVPGANGAEDGFPEGDPAVLRAIAPGEWMYFIHSYEMIPEDSRDILAVTYYGDHRVCAAVRRGNVCGLQFHPEKSGFTGLSILGNFLASA